MAGDHDTAAATLVSHDPVLADFAAEVGSDGPVGIEGGRTRWLEGGVLDPDARLVRAPVGIVDYVPEEMIVTVRAGTPVADVHAALAERGQRSALPERGGTVGGAVAVGQNDVSVLGRGTVRSAVLQVRYVSAEGRVVNGGGPTVKNVTGFDLPRLMVGSLGTLGFLAEVILRTNPMPAVSTWYRADDVDPFAAHRQVLAPSAVLYDGTTTSILLEGHGVDVDHQAAALQQVGAFVQCDQPVVPEGHRWSLAPAELARLDRHETSDFVALIGVGTVFADKPQPSRSLSAGVQIIHDRMKSNFDPTGRLNPGRNPGAPR